MSSSHAVRIPWGNVVMAALLMVATLPGRTQGLGLVTEPLLRDLKLDRVVYANINLWATLIGSVFCLPAGWLLDRVGLRPVTAVILTGLSFVVWRMSAHAGGVTMLWLWLWLTRALGQSALSVASITAVGKGTDRRAGLAMGVYSVLLSIFFIIAFVVVGDVVTNSGWRTAWWQIASALAVLVPLVLLFLREPTRAEMTTENLSGMSLAQAVKTQAFWIFSGATALFGLVSSGLGLFNEAVLAEAGFDQKTYHHFLAVTTMFALVGQGLCGWLTLKKPMPALLGVAMLLYAVVLGWLPMLHHSWQLWALAAIMGIAAGFITVIFFAVWGRAYGRAELGRIQGAAQMLTVFASAMGPLLFAECHVRAGSYAPLLYSLALIVSVIAVVAWCTVLPSPNHSAAPTA